MELNEELKSKNKMNINSRKNSSLSNNTPTEAFFSKQNMNNKSNLGELLLAQYIGGSIFEEINCHSETKEIMNELRSKYLPNSLRKRNFNEISIRQNMTYFNNKSNIKNNNSSYTDYYNSPKITTEKLNYYKGQNENSKIFKNTFLDNKEVTNINESIKLNNKGINESNLNTSNKNDDINISNNYNNNNLENKTYLHEYLREENERLKRVNKNYELLINLLIEYINDINYHFGYNIIDLHIINKISKQKDLSIDNKSLNDLKSFLKYNKDNICYSNRNEKNFFNHSYKLNIKDFINKYKINNNKREFTFAKEKKEDIDEYKPIIFGNNHDDSEKKIFKSSDLVRIKTTVKRLPISFWSQNKRVKFKD